MSVHFPLSTSSCMLLAGDQCSSPILFLWRKMDIPWTPALSLQYSLHFRQHASMLWELLVLVVDLQSFQKASPVKTWRPAVLRNCGNFRVKVKWERSSDYWRYGFENGSRISPNLFFPILPWNEWLYFLPCLGWKYNRTNESWTNKSWNNQSGTFETLRKNKYFLWTSWLFQVFICKVPES